MEGFFVGCQLESVWIRGARIIYLKEIYSYLLYCTTPWFSKIILKQKGEPEDSPV